MTLRKVQWADEEPSTSSSSSQTTVTLAKNNIYRFPKGSNDNGNVERTRQLVYIKSYSDYYADHIESVLPSKNAPKAPPKIEKNLSIVEEDEEEEEEE